MMKFLLWNVKPKDTFLYRFMCNVKLGKEMFVGMISGVIKPKDAVWQFVDFDGFEYYHPELVNRSKPNYQPKQRRKVKSKVNVQYAPSKKKKSKRKRS